MMEPQVENLLKVLSWSVIENWRGIVLFGDQVGRVTRELNSWKKFLKVQDYNKYERLKMYHYLDSPFYRR
ncbi:hypothetical protein FGO68_gene8012 [Halteria grandinella]|uniref:Uncharacterized protein n=1 Tax=Halteria grandinella TaxID=5974 RepID=A0A8J8TB00_HALGN|nr:hypothetical protein FGO68_gene8012 [Halteria grandinella]